MDYEAMKALKYDLKVLPKVITTVLVSIIYARFSSSILHPGILRFLALIPIISLFPFLPFSFSTIHFRGISGFLLTWLCLFKLLLLSFGHDPLDPSLSFIHFVSISTLPIKLCNNKKCEKITTFSSRLIFSTAIRAALLPAIFYIYRFKKDLNFYVLLSVYCMHIYLFLELILSISAICSRILGMELEPQFNKPYFATSLRDFWGWRWNLMVSAILRPSIYEPIKTNFGPLIGVLAAFLVSGIMHEIMFYYNNLRKPTGQVTGFFILHGVCVVVEWLWVKKLKWYGPPRVIGTLLTLGFVILSSFWLFFPPLIRGKTDEKVIMEVKAMVTLGKETSVWMISHLHQLT